jgi:hypothetical protein
MTSGDKMTPEMREEQQRRLKASRQEVLDRVDRKNDEFLHKLEEEFEYIRNIYGISDIRIKDEKIGFPRDTVILASILIEQREISKKLGDIKKLLETK